MRAEIKLLDPNLPVFRVMTMGELAGAALARPRFAATLLGGFAGVALLLAALGLYALLAFGVAQQTRELGLRMALGATGTPWCRGVVRRGLLLAGAGIVIGVGGGARAPAGYGRAALPDQPQRPGHSAGRGRC